MNNEALVGEIKVSEKEVEFLWQVLERVNPSGITGTETKLSLMKKVDALRPKPERASS